ncbi:MAG: hypothetical protein AAGJ32_10205 [Pseudomonadota bacterium]
MPTDMSNWHFSQEDDPATQRWLPTFLSPFGVTPRLHFTRAWTLLFFARVLAFVIPLAMVMILAAADPSISEEDDRDGGFGGLFLMTVLLTALLSFVLHLRRLRDAQRSPFWAGLALAPICAGMIGFSMFAASGAQDYTFALDLDRRQAVGIERRQMAVDANRQSVYKTLARDIFLSMVEDEVRARQTGKAGVKSAARLVSEPQAVTAALQRAGLMLSPTQRERFDRSLASEARGATSMTVVFGEFLDDTSARGLREDRREVGARWRRHFPNIDITEVSQRQQAVMTGVFGFLMFWALPSLLVMLWSLLWLGRLPTGGGTIASRMETLASMGAH